MPETVSPFALPERLAVKADPALIADDERRFVAVAEELERTVAALRTRLEEALRAPAGEGQDALDRDQEIHRLGARLRALDRFGLDLCLGRIVPAAGSAPIYIGRLGLTDRGGERLLVDWRSPAAEPFFAATLAHPMGLVSRRRYRWGGGRIVDYWDEVFTAEGMTSPAALDDQSAFISSLAASRSARMRDVLGTIQADQDAIIRAGSEGALVVDGGPGTGKTVVALHRSAYLLYSDPRVARRGLLFVGPGPAYLSYVSDVLPGLGEEGAKLCTLADLVPEGASAMEEADPRVAALKASRDMVRAVEAAVRYHERVPGGVIVETEWADIPLTADDWTDAFAAVEPGTAHNEAREQLRESLVGLAAARLGDDLPAQRVEAALRHSPELRAALNRAWPVLDPAGVVADLWSVPAYLRVCTPWLGAEEIGMLQRSDPRAWTTADLPLLDAARHLIGDPDLERRARRAEVAVARERERVERVIDELIGAQGDLDSPVWMLRKPDLQEVLVDPAVREIPDPDALAGPFAHVVVDEAQELTDAEWLMLLRRCPSRSMTIVGDRAQARHGFAGSWADRLRSVGVERVEVASLTVNYRTPEEVMAAAEPVIRAVLPDANVPVSVRPGGVPVRYGAVGELPEVVAAWLAAHDDGVGCVIGDPGYVATDRVRSLSPREAKGLEFDLVVLVDPSSWGDGVEGTVDRYVAMTRTTGELVVLGA